MGALLAALLGLAVVGLGPVQAAGRVAMVMVAEDYQKLPKSSVGAKRATDIAEALKARGFDVTVSTNPSNSGARAGLRDFSAKTAGADVAVVILIGHGTTAMGQSFFLPVNTEINVATDLLSRGIAVPSVAQIVAGAKTGAVFFLITTPTFPTPVDGLNARPEFAGEVARNVVTVFSSSAKVPVSRMDAASEQAAEALLAALQQPAPQFSEVVKAAANEVGAVFGSPADISLGKPAVIETAVPPPSPPQQDVQKNAEAEKRAREDQSRVDKATAEVQRAQEDARRAQAEVAKAQADARKAQADAERAQAEAEKAKAEARQVEAQAQVAKAQADAEKARAAVTTPNATPPAPPLDEKLLGQKQRQRIQERLREMSLYTGPLDSIMGPLTREAIMGYQRSRGAAVTGYLTPEQFQELVPGGT